MQIIYLFIYICLAELCSIMVNKSIELNWMYILSIHVNICNTPKRSHMYLIYVWHNRPCNIPKHTLLKKGNCERQHFATMP